MSIVGRQIEVGFAIEDNRGTAEAAAQKWAKHVSADIVPRTQKVVDDNTRGRLEDSQGARIVRKWYEGELSGVLHADTLGYLLLNLYGAVSSSNVSGSIYSHEFTLDQSIEHEALTIFRKDGGVENQAYGGGVISALEISASTEDYVRFSATVMAKNEQGHSLTPSYNTEYDFVGKDITIKVATSEAGLSGASAVKAKTLAIRFDPGVISDYVFGAETPDDHYNAKMSIEVEFTKNYEDTTFEDLFASDDYRYMQVAIVGDADLGGGNNPELTFLFHRVQVQNWERSSENDALSEETVTVKAFYNASDGEQSQVTLQNLTAAYEAAGS